MAIAGKTEDHGVQIREVHGLGNDVRSHVFESVANCSQHRYAGVLPAGLHRRHEHGEECEGDECDRVDRVARRESDRREQNAG
jgi:uncharacterized protein (DUF2384 family)